MDKNIQQTINDLFLMKEDELLLNLSNELFSQNKAIFIAPEEKEKGVSNAKLWWSNKFEEFKLKICASRIIDQYQSSESSKTKLEICSAIADLFISQFSQITACTIAVLMFNFGLDSLCDKDEDNNKKNQN